MRYILDEETITEMVTRDTISVLTQRVRRLVESGRRMTVVTRWVGNAEETPKIATGLTLDGPVTVTGDCTASTVTFYLTDLVHFGYSTNADEPAAPLDMWAQYHRHDRRNMTRMTIHGGRPADGMNSDDRIIITHWDATGTCREILVGFDPGQAPAVHLLPKLDVPAKAQVGDRIQANAKGIAGNVLVVRDSAGIAWRRSTPDDDALVTLRDFSWLAVDGGGCLTTDILTDHAPLTVTQIKTPASAVAYVGDLISGNVDDVAPNVLEVVNCEGERWRRATPDQRVDEESGQEYDWVHLYEGEVAGRCTTIGLLDYTPLKVTETMHMAGAR